MFAIHEIFLNEATTIGKGAGGSESKVSVRALVLVTGGLGRMSLKSAAPPRSRTPAHRRSSDELTYSSWLNPSLSTCKSNSVARIGIGCMELNQFEFPRLFAMASDHTPGTIVNRDLP